LEKQVKAFVDGHKGDLDGKTKFLTFGSVGYRQSTSLRFSGVKADEVLERLKALKLHDCILTKETVNRDILRTKTPDTLEKVGAKMVSGDTFYYEVDREKVRR
jgi:phage host-nuclease inhibitor protein Gam